MLLACICNKLLKTVSKFNYMKTLTNVNGVHDEFILICSSFKNTISNSGYMSNYGIIVNNELERTWKEVVVA
jgi:hypothetical protein